jgi:hypothetical protein
MQAIGVLLLAAATAGDGFGYSDPGVGLKKWLRPHVEVSAAATGAPPYTAATMAARGAGPANGRRFTVTKSQIHFLDPDHAGTGHMQIGWQTSAGNGERIYPPPQLVVPARYNFNQGFIYRLKMTNIPGRPNRSLYPSIEVAPSTPVTDAYLAHNAIPVQFTNEDFDQVIDGGNFVTKVIYLPDPKYQELAVSGVETLVSTRLEPGVDPILEADKRGTVLLIVRVGAIDLEMPGPGMVAGTGVGVGIGDVAPGSLPPGVAPAVAPPGTVILDPTTPTTQPVTPPAPAPAPPPVPQPGAAPAPAPAAPKPASADAGPADTSVPTTALAPMPEPPAVQPPAPATAGEN